MTDDPMSQPWGTSQRYVEPPGGAVAAGDGADDGRHALPVEPVADEQPPTSYGTFFEHPPYATETAPMTVDVPEETAVAPRPLPTPTRPSPADAGPQENVTCPECGAGQRVNLNRRDATDFCRRCDFPLFWTPARITRDWNPASSSEALRRLPGTGGSQRLASAACPHCRELNYATAQICVRCGGTMHIAPPPPPAPAPYVPPFFAPEPEPEPENGVPWWVWLILGVGIVAAVVVVILFATGVF